jgi:hypothetical protein
MACFFVIVVGVLTKQMNGDRPNPVDYGSARPVEATAERDQTSADPSSLPLMIAREPTIAETLSALVKELGKQAIDQPGHFLIAALPILLSRYFTGTPWYGWPVIPLLAYREWLQWPSDRWWDPPLDWAVLALGVIMATWALGALRSFGTPRS